jgi:TfoX/Sxy family transcriptional regulator of competence genes
MAWVKVPAAHHPLFYEALPSDPRVETRRMFGGIAAKVNGHVFAGLFGRSTMIWLPEGDRADALALPGAAPFDPLGDGRKSNKVMLPERMMAEPTELRRWITRAFTAASRLPPKERQPDRARRVKLDSPAKTTTGKASRAKRSSVDSASGKRPGKPAAK